MVSEAFDFKDLKVNNMDLLQSVLRAGGGDVVRQLAQKFGQKKDEAAAGIAGLIPAIARGVQNKIASDKDCLVSVLASGQHVSYAQMMPLVATLAIGVMSKHLSSGDLRSANVTKQSWGLRHLIGSVLSVRSPGALRSSALATVLRPQTKSN